MAAGQPRRAALGRLQFRVARRAAIFAACPRTLLTVHYWLARVLSGKMFPSLARFSLLSLCVQAAARLPNCYVKDEGHSASAKLDILQLVHHAKPTRILLMQLYRPFFSGQIFMLTTRDADLVSQFANVDILLCNTTVPERGSLNNYYPPCIARLLNAINSPAGFRSDNAPADGACSETVRVTGLLYHHMDMWVNPSKMLRFDVKRPWAPESGLIMDGPNYHSNKPLDTELLFNFCGAGETLDHHQGWPWSSNSKTECLAAVAALAASPHAPKNWEAGRICYGHADLFYLPASMFQTFAVYAPFFNRTWHEVSVPTLLAMVAAEHSSQIVNTSCSGSCCTDITGFLRGPHNDTDLSAIACGHRVDFSLPEVRQHFRVSLVRATGTCV